MAGSKGITIYCSVAESIERVTLDRHRLLQVLYNLLSNAVKFTGTGGEVHVSADGHGASGLLLRVRDTGIGIGRDDLDNLFTEFGQLGSGPGTQHTGTGLGLALTKRIVEGQLGSIAVESEPGRGSLFTVILPFAAEGSATIISPEPCNQ
jgi:signal transduction histidine kinase